MNSPHSSNPTKKDSWFRNLFSINITLLVKLSLFMEKIKICAKIRKCKRLSNLQFQKSAA